MAWAEPNCTRTYVFGPPWRETRPHKEQGRVVCTLVLLIDIAVFGGPEYVASLRSTIARPCPEQTPTPRIPIPISSSALQPTHCQTAPSLHTPV